MITHVEMSVQMEFVLKLIALNLRNYGHTNPFIIAVNKDTNPGIDLKSETVLDSKIFRIRDVEILTDELPEPGDFYIQVLLLRLNTDEDEDAMHKIFQRVAKQFDPEAIGFVQSCLYNEYPDADAVTRDEMVKDPGNIHVIHMCYYLKGDCVARIRIMPFLAKGLKKPDYTSLGPVPDDEEPEQEHIVLMSDCAWFRENRRVSAIIEYPYEKGKSYESVY